MLIFIKTCLKYVFFTIVLLFSLSGWKCNNCSQLQWRASWFFTDKVPQEQTIFLTHFVLTWLWIRTLTCFWWFDSQGQSLKDTCSFPCCPSTTTVTATSLYISLLSQACKDVCLKLSSLLFSPVECLKAWWCFCCLLIWDLLGVGSFNFDLVFNLVTQSRREKPLRVKIVSV